MQVTHDPHNNPCVFPLMPDPTDLTYGSDSSGLICGFVFSAQAAPRPVDSVAALLWMNSARASDQRDQDFIWLHFNLSNVQSEKWLRAHFALPEQFYDSLREGTGSTRIEQVDDCLTAIVNDVVFDFSYDASQIATMWMCINHDFAISMRLRPLRSVDRLRQSARKGERLASPVSLLAHLLRDQADVLEQIAHTAAIRVDEIEDNLLAGRVDTKRSALGSLRRLLVRLRRLLAPEPGALFRLLNRPPEWVDDEDAAVLRAATEEFSGVLSDLTALQERTKLLQEEIVAHTTEQTNRSVFLLTMATVLALPLNIIAGLFGMNVGGIPFNQDPEGFWIITSIVITFAGIAGWIAFFKQRS